MTAREDTIKRIGSCLELTSEKSLTVTIPRLTAERAVSLLKEQEPVEPTQTGQGWFCGGCGTLLEIGNEKNVRFCCVCGRSVKWE